MQTVRDFRFTRPASSQTPSFIKLAEKAAETQPNLNDREQRQTIADKLLPEHTAGLLADYLSPSQWGGERAGRAKQLARASGRDAGFSVNHPLTSDFASMLAGMAGGGLVGAATGELGKFDPTASGGMTVGGALGGSLLGLVLSRLHRRKRLNQIKDDFVNTDSPVLSEPRFTAGGFFNPLRAAHRTGQGLAYKELRTGKGMDNRSHWNDAAYIGAPILGLLNPGVGLGVMAGQNFMADSYLEPRKK